MAAVRVGGSGDDFFRHFHAEADLHIVSFLHQHPIENPVRQQLQYLGKTAEIKPAKGLCLHLGQQPAFHPRLKLEKGLERYLMAPLSQLIGQPHRRPGHPVLGLKMIDENVYLLHRDHPSA